MKEVKKTENKVSIYKNCIIERGHHTLFFLLNAYNYTLYTEESIEMQIRDLHNLITSIESVFSNFSFTLTRFSDFVSPEKYVESFIDTIRLWDNSFIPSKSFLNNIQYITKSYCVLAINIDEKKSIDFNQASIKDMIKENVDNFMEMITSFNQQKVDTDKIDKLTTAIENISRNLIKPCPENILLSYYLKRIFPSYNLIINSNDYDSTKAVIGYLQQTFEPKLNYFKMSNSGVELFENTKAQDTYGCVIDILDFPEEIISEHFALYHDGMVINNRMLDKKKAQLKFKREQSDIEFEEETAYTAESSDGLVELDSYKDVVDKALAAVAIGKKIVESDIHILVLANDLDTLNKKRAEIIAELKDRDIIATFSPDQGQSYVDSFIKLRPKKYPFIFDLYYPLSFRINQGNAICDIDSELTSPIIGVQSNVAEATE